jgi:YgiT-type zinc finger domain-containing protein
MGVRLQDEEALMRCVICKTGDVKPGTTSFTVERGTMTLVLKGVPARVCGQCGEAYFDETTTKHIEEIAERASHTGVQVAVQDYAAA